MPKTPLSLTLGISLLLVAFGARTAKADSVSLADGSTVSGTTVLTLVGGVPNLDPGASWTITSTDGGVWTDQNSLYAASAGTGPSGSFTGFALTTNSLDAEGSGTQYQIGFLWSGTFAQFASMLSTLPVGQSVQVQLLTSNCSPDCSNLTTSIVSFGALVSQSVVDLSGAAYLTFTNDPGTYDVTLTSTPLQSSAVPEPSSALLFGLGLFVLGVARYKQQRITANSVS